MGRSGTEDRVQDVLQRAERALDTRLQCLLGPQGLLTDTAQLEDGDVLTATVASPQVISSRFASSFAARAASLRFFKKLFGRSSGDFT